MKEVSFIRQNIEKWKSLERVVDDFETRNPSEIADAYTVITSDLSFARSHYPQSRITIYLNNLALMLHNSLHKTKKEHFSRIKTFWTQEIPDAMYRSRKDLLYSFIVFIISVLIGVISALNDDSFVRLILGDGYVDMTLANIQDGDPMGVYKDMSPVPMFLRIAYNNIGVSFYIFVLGLLTGFGTGYGLFSNGVMIGAFQTFFFQQGADLGFESVLAVWCHGTFEISAIVIAGAAGFALGNGWFFPGTYPRLYAFKQGAMRGLKIIVGLIPVFLIAAFLESFITRHTEYPTAVRLSIIIVSFLCVVFYYLILPYLRAKRKEKLITNH
ncbi:MAG: stage II sporulation protein M [Tannerella sp.]|jgi:uncharacterized membrane protein SpoIIM required for sporulation|nr:stage II sporulation protein M [Tannerella sp.]